MSEPEMFHEASIGWRTWQLQRTAEHPPSFGSWAVRTPDELPESQSKGGVGQFDLVSGGNTIWPAYERLTADCRTNPEHEAPAKSCGCGIYAARSHQLLREMGYAAGPNDSDAPDLVGEVWMWGHAFTSNIIRSQFAYPKRLYLPGSKWWLAKPLGHLYGVPVIVTNPFTMEVPDEEGER